MKEKIKNLGRLFFPLILGGVVGILIANFMDYETLKQPPFAPPSILFPIVWTILYLLMGVSYVIITKQGKQNADLQMIYYLQLFVNLFWPIFFFVLNWKLFSIFWIILLILLVLVMIRKFFKENRVAGILQIPYLLWLFFATYLNIAIVILN